MIRAAAKNHAYAAVVVKPEAYDAVLEELRDGRRPAVDADARVRSRPRRSPTPRATTRRSRAGSPRRPRTSRRCTSAPTRRSLDLPYGENPHQRAAFYAQVGARAHVLSQVAPAPRQGALVQQPPRPRRARATLARDLRAARLRRSSSTTTRAARRSARRARRPTSTAFACDPVSAYGGVIALNRRSTAPTAEALAEQFIEVLFAPGYEDDALEVLTQKPNLRHPRGRGAPRCPRSASRDDPPGRPAACSSRTATASRDDRERRWRSSPSARPTEAGVGATCSSPGASARHVKSNAIVLAREQATLGIGAGQMSRVDSVRLAVEKAQADRSQGAALASDAFFPFADGPELGDRGRRHGDHPARRLGARRRGRRGGRGGRRRDGLHRAPPLPPLSGAPVTASSASARAARRGRGRLLPRRARRRARLGRRAARRSRRTGRRRARRRRRAGAAGASRTSRRRSSGSARRLARRRAHAHVRHRHRALGGGRPRPRRGRSATSARSPRWSTWPRCIDPRMLVEIEADAFVAPGPSRLSAR